MFFKTKQEVSNFVVLVVVGQTRYIVVFV